MRRLLIGWLMMLLTLPLQAGDILTLGVSAYRPKPVMEAMYAPLADYLSQQLGDTHVELRVLEGEEITEALARNQLDFLLTNPGHYLVVRSRSTLSGALATVVRRERNTPTSVLGGVIVTRAENEGIRQLTDLRGLRIAHPGPRYLGGYLAQAYELQQEGINLPKDAQLLEMGSHDAVVKAVLNGRADVGFIRTGIIEWMTAEGMLDPARLRVIHQQNLSGYPFISSTRLYPEWPFVALPHVEAHTVRRVAGALLQLQADHPAARAAGLDGFAPPVDYLPLENLARALRIPPYDVIPHISLRDIVNEYAAWLLALVTLVVLLAAGGLAFLLQNRRLRSSQAALGQQTRRLNEVIWGTNIGTWEWNIQTGETRFNERWAEIAGYSLAELAPVSIETRTQLTHPDDLVHSGVLLEQCFRRERDTYESEVRMRHKDGHWVWGLERGRVVEWTAEGRPLRMSGTLQDITQRKENELALHESEGRLRVCIERFPGAVLAESADRRIVLANPTFCDWFHIPHPPEALIGMDSRHSTEQAKRLFAEPDAFVERINQLALGQDHALGESIAMTDGRVLERDYMQVRDGKRLLGHVWFYRDITHIKAHQKELEHIAHHDALTGLPNRLLLADRMQQAMAHSQRRGTHLAVVYLDLDGFKAVNDTFGHDTGDTLLIELVARIQSALRQGDTLARLGGDEFVAVLGDLEHKADAIPVLERLLEAASTPLDIRGQNLKVSASLGVSFYPQDGVDADMLLRQADHAMYLAKQGGRNCYRLFDA